LIMISTYFAFNASSKRNFILAGLFFILLLFCRPAGVFYVISLIFVILKLHRSKFAPAFLFTALAVVFIAIIFFIPLRNNDFALPIYQGSVICGFPAYPQSVLPNENYTLAEVYSEFVKQHDAFTLASLFFKKTLSFFTLTRQYYSFNHNLINSLYYIFFPGAFFSIWNFLKRKEKNLMVTYFISILTTNCIIVGLTYNEWSERFFVPLLPFFILSTMLAIGKTRHYQEI